MCYGKQHDVHFCEEFYRKTFADKKRLGHTKRLKGGYMIEESRSSKTRAESLSNRTDHHTLLHSDHHLSRIRPQSGATSRDFGMHVDKASSAYLDILPVRVCHGG